MNDTAPDVQEKLNALFAQRSGSERVRMVCEMFDFARSLIAGNILDTDPHISPTELRVKIFERTYGDDVDSVTRARVIARLRREQPNEQR